MGYISSQIQQGRERYTLGEYLEPLFTDKDSENKNYDYESYVEFVPGNEDDSTCKESHLDDSMVMPHSSYRQDLEIVSRKVSGTYLMSESKNI